MTNQDTPQEAVIHQAISAARAVRAETTRTESGVSRPKTRTDRAYDAGRLSAFVELLDAWEWHGEWGRNQHAIKMELLRRAQS